MARHLAATREGARATFLLEVALDRARLKQRLAAVLLEERGRRGGGDARRFPQPDMARLLDYSLRQYQRLEDPDDKSIPSWSDLERIMAVLDLDATEIFGTPEKPTPTPVQRDGDRDLRELRDDIARKHHEVMRRLDELAELARAAAATRSRN